MLIIQNVFRVMVVQILNKQHHDKTMKNSESYQYLKYLFVLPIATFMMLNGFIISDQSQFKYFLICFGGVCMIMSNILEFSIVEKLLKAEFRAKEREMFAQKTKLEQIYYSRLEEINCSNAEYIHEMNHFMNTIKQLSCTENNDVIQTLASKVSQKSKPMIHKYYLDDKITNAIFLEREKKSIDLGIKYHVDIQPGVDLAYVEDMDKISMFGNLLDNALEAAAGTENGYIYASLFYGNNSFVVFKVENNFKSKPKKKGKNYLTGKENEELHGFGIKKVEELAEKYKGILNIEDSDNTFIVILMLSNVKLCYDGIDLSCK